MKFLCRSCNSRLGSSVEARAKSDPSVQLAAWALSSEIPELASSILEGEDFIMVEGPEKVVGSVRKGSFLPKRPQPDGSFLHPEPEAREALEKTLRRRGEGREVIARALDTLDEASPGEPVRASSDLVLVKRQVTGELRPSLVGQPMSDQLLLLMAYGFLAAILQSTIYSDELGPVREAIATGADSECYRVDRFQRGREWRTFHSLGTGQLRPYAVIELCLFGWLLYRVHVPAAALPGPRVRYVCDLELSEQWIEGM